MKTFVLAAVDVVLVARQLVPILCFAIERATGTEDKPQTTKSLACMGCIIAGVAVYARGKAEASDRGTSEAATTFAWTLALHLASTSVANVYTKHVCQRGIMRSLNWNSCVTSSSGASFVPVRPGIGG